MKDPDWQVVDSMKPHLNEFHDKEQQLEQHTENDTCRVGNVLKELPSSQRKFLRFNKKELNLLTQEFVKDPYPDIDSRRLIANKLQVPEKSILNWFVNRRHQIRKSFGFNQDLCLREEFLSQDNRIFLSKTRFYWKDYIGRVPVEDFNQNKNECPTLNASFKPWRPWVTHQK